LKATRSKLLCWLFNLLLALVLAAPALAQQPITFQYFYDNLGRLSKVIDSTDTVIEYVYDEVGNILEIKRSSISGLAIFDFSPRQGPVGTTVTIQGQGFSPTPANNQVMFNGAAAAVISATATSLVVTVLPGATTGPVAVTVSGNTATSTTNFTVLPSITAINPALVLAGSTITGLQVQGGNLLGSVFTFTPEFTPPAVTITSASIDPSGTMATLNVDVGANATGSFVLVATNAAGSSSPVPSVANTLIVLDGGANNDNDRLVNADELQRGTNPFDPDTDDDGFSDGEEVEFGSNPLDKNSTPIGSGVVLREANGAPVSTLNTVDPSTTVPHEASGPTVSVLNTVDPSTTVPHEASGPTVSVLNTVDPSTTVSHEASGPPVSVLNGTDPSGPSVNEADGLPVSVKNQ
jgi:YD repeat-containing protein